MINSRSDRLVSICNVKVLYDIEWRDSYGGSVKIAYGGVNATLKEVF